MALWLKESPEDSYGIFIHGYERESIDFQPPWVVYFIEQHVETTKLWGPYNGAHSMGRIHGAFTSKEILSQNSTEPKIRKLAI